MQGSWGRGSPIKGQCGWIPDIEKEMIWEKVGAVDRVWAIQEPRSWVFIPTMIGSLIWREGSLSSLM